MSWHLQYKVETYGRVVYDTDDNIIRTMHFAYGVNKVYKRSHDI